METDPKFLVVKNLHLGSGSRGQRDDRLPRLPHLFSRKYCFPNVFTVTPQS